MPERVGESGEIPKTLNHTVQFFFAEGEPLKQRGSETPFLRKPHIHCVFSKNHVLFRQKCIGHGQKCTVSGRCIGGSQGQVGSPCGGCHFMQIMHRQILRYERMKAL